MNMAQGTNKGIIDFKWGCLEMLYRGHRILKVNWDFSMKNEITNIAEWEKQNKTKPWENIEQLWNLMTHSGNKV